MIAKTPERHFVDFDKLNARSIIVDAGAGSGVAIETLRSHEQTKECEIFAIECSRTNIRALKKKNFQNVTICEKALVGQSYDGSVTFFQLLGLPDSGNIYARKPKDDKKRFKGRRIYRVKTLKINDIFEEFGIDKIDYMKIDIEASEKEAIETMSEETASKIAQMSVEFHFHPDSEIRKELEERVESLGFEKKLSTKFEVFFERQEED